MMDFNLILSVSVISHYNCESARYFTNKDFQGLECFMLLMSKELKQLQMGNFKHSSDMIASTSINHHYKLYITQLIN